MTTQNSESWLRIKSLLDQKISIIPVRDKDDDTGVRKSPYPKWKEFQERIITESELWFLLEKHNTSAIAMIGGKVSGNLEIIDIDVKHKPGIDATFFADIKNIYPELFSRLRIHSTPSGGYHIPFRISNQQPPGNLKLSGRPSLEDELLKEPKIKNRYFIETRGEGGYVLCPPSSGYSVRKDVPIPILTWEERNSIIQLAQSYNEILPEPEKKYTAHSKAGEDYYDENPFSHYNNMVDPVELFEKYGWKMVNANNQRILFTKPGGKGRDVHGAFLHQRRVFYIFSTNTDLEPEKSYTPSAILAHYEFNGDNKELFKNLVSRGFGRIKPQKEREIVQRGRELPANASQQARKLQEEHQKHLSETYPFGIFWEYDEDAKLRIDREGLYQVANGLGYRYHAEKLYQIRGIFVFEIKTEREFFDIIKAYIREEDADTYKLICNTYESFIQKNGSFSIGRLELLDVPSIIADTKNSAYKFYQNGYLYITSEKHTFHSYDNISGLIWASECSQRHHQQPSSSYESKYENFLKLACQLDIKLHYIQRIIGYLAHRYKDETTGYIIVITETVADPAFGGGSGKNIFCSLLSHTTTFLNIPASQSRPDERFLQPWNYERVLSISDLPKNFDFLFLKELSTGTGILKKLFKNQVTIEADRMPKLIAQTNYSYEITDGGLRRRIIPLEFTDFFTNSKGVDIHYNCHFPGGWSAEDWASYDSFIAQSISRFFEYGNKLEPDALSHTGWHKQFALAHGHQTIQFIEENIQDWVARKTIPTEEFNTIYNSFCETNNIDRRFRKSGMAMNKALAEYSKFNQIEFSGNELAKIEGIGRRCKTFIQEPDINTLLNMELPF